MSANGRQFHHIAILGGGGLMGHGIALACLQGSPAEVVLLSRREETVRRGLELVENGPFGLNKAVKRGKLEADRVKALMGRLSGTTDYAKGLAGADLVFESIPEMAEYMEPAIRGVAMNPLRQRQGVFPSLDAIHYPNVPEREGSVATERVRASDHRAGSGEDLEAFLDKADLAASVLFPSEGLSVGFIQVTDYAVRLCRAFNDYVADRYLRVNDRMHPMALIPMQDPDAAVVELRRAVRELALPGAMLPSTGLPLHLGHRFYWPVYEEAASLGCALGVHGGSNRGIGIDTFDSGSASHVLHHPVPLMHAMVGMIYAGLFDRLPDLRVGFMEGGAAWVIMLYDRMTRDEEYRSGGTMKRRFPEYLASGQVLIGCEGDDASLPHIVGKVGVESFAWASDYPHEVDLPAARQMIQHTIDHPELTADQKAAVLGGNATRFFRL